MFKAYPVTDRKYRYLDIAVLFILLVVLPVLQDYEHFLMFKRPTTRTYLSTLPSNFYYFLANFAICFIYYRLILKPLIFRGKWAAVLISAIAFSSIHNLYTKYAVIWLAIHLPFLDENYRHMAQFHFDSFDIHFNLAMALGSNFLIMTGFAYFTKSLQQKKQMERIRHEQMVSEMAYLKAQLQPHFFFNTLNNIYALAISQSPDAGPMISRLSEMMRYIIYRAEDMKVPLQQEIDFISNYVEIERIRHHKSAFITLDIQGDVEGIEVEPLLLLAIVENAFKHGLHKEGNSDRVEIVICVIDAELIVEVFNSKPISQVPSFKEGGLGLKNLVKRLELLYPGRHQLTLEQHERYYQAILTLKLT